jgi:hypothetical protein
MQEDVPQPDMETLLKDLLLNQKMNNDNFNFKGMYGELFEKEQKHTSSQHEICVKVTFQVFSVDTNGETVHCPKVVENNYYIPLPLKEEFDKYIEKFNGFLTEAMSKAAENLSDS